jgi:hypothetical protein
MRYGSPDLMGGASEKMLTGRTVYKTYLSSEELCFLSRRPKFMWCIKVHVFVYLLTVFNFDLHSTKILTRNLTLGLRCGCRFYALYNCTAVEMQIWPRKDTRELSRPALWPTQPPIQWVPCALSTGVKRTGREADQSSPYSAEVKN